MRGIDRNLKEKIVFTVQKYQHYSGTKGKDNYEDTWGFHNFPWSTVKVPNVQTQRIISCSKTWDFIIKRDNLLKIDKRWRQQSPPTVNWNDSIDRNYSLITITKDLFCNWKIQSSLEPWRIPNKHKRFWSLIPWLNRYSKL